MRSHGCIPPRNAAVIAGVVDAGVFRSSHCRPEPQRPAERVHFRPVLPAMTETPTTLFALVEADHLTRIHLKLGLEDVGFDVREAADTIALLGCPDADTAAATPRLEDVATPPAAGDERSANA